MTDETPQPEGEPKAAAPEASPTEVTQPITPSRDEDDVVEPTQANPVAVAAAAASPGSTTAPAAAPPASADRPAGFFVPKWVGIVAAAVIAALVFGAVGYTIGDSSSDSDSSNSSSRVFPGGATNGNGPFANGGLPNGLPGNSGNGNGGSSGSGSGTSGNGSGSGSTQTPNNGGFLGVAVQTGTNGVTISSVQNGSPAATAGLQQATSSTQSMAAPSPPLRCSAPPSAPTRAATRSPSPTRATASRARRR